MDTRWTKWTAIQAVKILSFILVVALAFIMLNRFVTSILRNDYSGIRFESVFMENEGEQYLFDNRMNRAFWNASVLHFFGSEESILAGNHIEWLGTADSSSLHMRGGSRTYQWTGDIGIYELRAIRDGVDDIEINHGIITQEMILDWERMAISEQLSAFRFALESLKGANGLSFSIQTYSKGTDEPLRAIAMSSDLPDNVNVMDWFRNHRVFFIQVGEDSPESSHVGNFTSFPEWSRNSLLHDGELIFLAFDDAFVSSFVDEFETIRWEYIRDIIIGAAALVLVLAFFAIMLMGAGRRFGCSSCKSLDADQHRPRHIHLLLVDRIFLDLGLAMVMFWIYLVLTIGDDMLGPIIRTSSIEGWNIVIAVVCVAIGVPVLLWLLGLAKRIKAGQVWKHTLVYAFFNLIYRLLKRLAVFMWSGKSHWPKIGVIAFSTFIIFLIVGIIGIMSGSGGVLIIACVVVTLAVSAVIVRYVQVVTALRSGAEKICNGDFSQTIEVEGGDLGSIAESINNIGIGINAAVEERMKSERLKTELITNVSHDIRTPLTSIITYTDLLKHEGLDCEKAPEYLDILIQKSQRLKTLTDELFEAAKAATGNIEVSITELDIVSLINQVMGEMDTAIANSDLDIRFSHPDHLMIKADGRLMWRVMENLLSNVLKYALPSSRVYLAVSHAGTPYVHIEIKNVSAQELNVDPSELTERFKRGDDSRTDGGSGLGLSIVQSFVEAQNGKFEVAIDGDLFKATIWLPAAE